MSAGNKAQCRELLVDNACFMPFLFHMYFFIHELDYELILGLGCGFDDREIGIRFPIGASRLVLGGYSACCAVGTRSFFPELKRPVRDADHSPKVENAWTWICLYSVAPN